MKSRLVTIARNDILYLPVLLLNSYSTEGALGISEVTELAGTVPLSADDATTSALAASGSIGATNFYDASKAEGNAIVIDQGLNTNAISPERTIAADLFEDSYSIQLDNRLLTLTDGASNNVDISFIDDDNIALYNVSFPVTI